MFDACPMLPKVLKFTFFRVWNGETFQGVKSGGR